jgi:hypothetical protein
MQLLFLLLPLLVQSPIFQGEITLAVTSSQYTGNIQLWIAPKGIRADLKRGNESSSVLLQNGNAYQLNHSAKQYSDIDLAEQKRMSLSLGKLEKMSFEKLADESVLGYPCKHFTLNSAAQRFELWTTDALLDTASLAQITDAGGLIGLNATVYETMSQQGVAGFPLKIISTRDAQGALKEELRVEATRVSKRAVKSSLLTLPKNYKEMP